MPSHKDDEQQHDAAMGSDPFGDDEEVLARTLYSSTGGPLVASAPALAHEPSDAMDERETRAPQQRTTAPAVRKPKPARSQQPARKPRRRRQKAKPEHYKVLSISLYNDDIAKMDALVRDLKKDGFTRMNRSALIRFALDQVDVSKMPHGY